MKIVKLPNFNNTLNHYQMITDEGYFLGDGYMVLTEKSEEALINKVTNEAYTITTRNINGDEYGVSHKERGFKYTLKTVKDIK